MLAPQLGAVGSIRGFMPRVLIRRYSVNHTKIRIWWSLYWVGHGQRIAVFSTTGPRPIQRANPGPNARNISGGTKQRVNGWATMCQTLLSIDPPLISRPKTPKGRPRLGAWIRLLCRVTAKAGSMRQ